MPSPMHTVGGSIRFPPPTYEFRKLLLVYNFSQVLVRVEYTLIVLSYPISLFNTYLGF